MTTFDFQPDTVILGGGDYPTHPLPLSLLQNAPRVQCCDGAAAEYIRRGHIPWRIIGDCDSIPDDIRRQYADRVVVISEQETNDQTKNVIYARDHGFKRIAIVGATGRREDHTIGNISLLTEYYKMGLDVRIYTDHGMFVICNGSTDFAVRPGTQISIFNWKAYGFKSSGLKYPLYDFDALWMGTLNEATNDAVTISAEGKYIVFVNYYIDF
ncbi:MAG: thiamine diphosphokinase [Bacteroidales bacterium]|nr:thiamine diphosphokinase [Bacteroidales bacterium]